MDDARLVRIEAKFDQFSVRVDDRFEALSATMAEFLRVEVGLEESRKQVSELHRRLSAAESDLVEIRRTAAVNLAEKGVRIANRERAWWICGMLVSAIAGPTIVAAIAYKYIM